MAVDEIGIPEDPHERVELTAGEQTNDLWPFVSDPVLLLTEIVEWLLEYGSHATRYTYAQDLGLPVSGNDFADWAYPANEPVGWAATRDRYARALEIPAPRPITDNLPHKRGRYRAWHWFRWLIAHELDPLTVRSAHVKQWLDDLANAGAAPGTRDGMRAAAKSLYEHLADKGLCDANPIAIRRRRNGLDTKSNTSSTIVLTTAQVRALIRAAGTRGPHQTALEAARALVVVTLFTVGLRVSEVCGLNRDDLHVTRGRRALRILGKGEKVRIVYLSVLADDALTAYLALLDGTAGAIVTSLDEGPRAAVPLLVGRTGRRYGRAALWEMLRRITASGGDELASVATVMHPHALRHFYVTTAVEANVDLGRIADDIGHASTDTTRRIYDHATRDPLRSAVDVVADAIMHK
jgi:site-specific recombinase XerD